MLMMMATVIVTMDVFVRSWYADRLVQISDFDSESNTHDGVRTWSEVVTIAHSFLATSESRRGLWWVKERSLIWFDYYLWQSFETSRWLKCLRMPKELFCWICEQLAHHIRRSNTRFRNAVPVEVRVGAVLFRLSTGMSYFHVADRFGIGESTVQELMDEVISAIVEVLGPSYLAWPRGEEMMKVSEGFLRKSGLPNCQGAIDGTHIRIKTPIGASTAVDYYNRKGYHSLVLQGIVDSDGVFLDISVGMPGNTNDRRVLQRSKFFPAAQAGEVLQEPEIIINSGFRLKPYILGDSGYTMFPWLLIPYNVRHGNGELQELFTTHHIRGRLCVEQAFGILKARFPILSIGISSSVQWAARLVHATCILHNILVKKRVALMDRSLESFCTPPGTIHSGVNALRPGDSALLVMIASLRTFTRSTLNFWMNTASGIRRVSYFLAKDSVDHFNTVVKPLVYLSMFYFFNRSRSTFVSNYIITLALVCCVTGIAYIPSFKLV